MPSLSSADSPTARGDGKGLRIMLVCNSYPPEIGAAPTRMYGLAQLLRGAGYAVEVVCAMPNYPTGRILPGYRGKLHAKEIQEGVLIRRLPFFPTAARGGWRRVGSMASHAASLWALLFLYLLRRKPALVIVSSPPLPMAAAGVAIARAVGCRVLLNVSDLWPLSALELGAVRPGPVYRALEGLERRMYRRAHAATGQSEEILQHISQVVERPLFLYRNLPGRGEQRAASGDADLPHSHIATPSHSPRRLLYAGQLGPVQGIAGICAQHDFAALGLTLSLYGDGPERTRIQEIIGAAPGRGVTLHDPVPLSSLPALLHGFDAALVPLTRALTGAVPSKLFTAVGAGLPVIFCGGGEGARIVELHGLGWVSSPGSQDGLRTSLYNLSTQTAEEHAAMRRRCAEAAQTIFSKEAQDTAFLQFLATVFSLPANGKTGHR